MVCGVAYACVAKGLGGIVLARATVLTGILTGTDAVVLRTVRPGKARVALACVCVYPVDASTIWIENDLAVPMSNAVSAFIVNAVVGIRLTSSAVEASVPTVTAKLVRRHRFIIYTSATIFAERSLG